VDAQSVKGVSQEQVLARGIDVGAPELPAVEGSADFQALLGRDVVAEGRGAQECAGAPIGHGERDGGGVLQPGLEERGQSGRVSEHGLGQECPHAGIHEINQASRVVRRERNQADPVAGEDDVVSHWSIQSPRGWLGPSNPAALT
jgi:hypothetical protein